jgi:hypothetical protein
VEREDATAFGGKATLREVTLTWGAPDMAIHLLLVVPNRREKPAPVFFGMNFTGNHTVVADRQVRLAPVRLKPGAKGEPRNPEEDRGKHVDTWCIEENIDRGYAVATFFNGDVVPDDPKLAEEVLRKFRGGGSEERSESAAGTIAIWAWCLQRAVDHLVTLPELDSKRLAVVGHSRNGKTALLAAAFDERIAMAIPSQAGCGGTAPSRVAPELAAKQPNGRPIAETVAVITKSFPHWFCKNFAEFGEAPERLPFDQHSLIALCAPRPVLLSNAAEDLWANPAGQFEMLRQADPVYRLVAGDGHGATEMPEMSKLLPSRLGYFIRPGVHSMTRAEWGAWWEFADRWLR